MTILPHSSSTDVVLCSATDCSNIVRPPRRLWCSYECNHRQKERDNRYRNRYTIRARQSRRKARPPKTNRYGTDQGGLPESYRTDYNFFKVRGFLPTVVDLPTTCMVPGCDVSEKLHVDHDHVQALADGHLESHSCAACTRGIICSPHNTLLSGYDVATKTDRWSDVDVTSYVNSRLFVERPVNRMRGSAVCTWRYNISVDEYTSILSGACVLCKINPATDCDHDRRCCRETPVCGLCIRGGLCRGCNFILGRYEKSLVFIDDYLEVVNNSAWREWLSDACVAPEFRKREWHSYTDNIGRICYIPGLVHPSNFENTDTNTARATLARVSS